MAPIYQIFMTTASERFSIHREEIHTPELVHTGQAINRYRQELDVVHQFVTQRCLVSRRMMPAPESDDVKEPGVHLPQALHLREGLRNATQEEAALHTRTPYSCGDGAACARRCSAVGPAACEPLATRVGRSVW